MNKNKKVFDLSQISKFMTVNEASAVGRMHPVSVRNLFTRGKLVRYKLGRKTLIDREEFMNLIQPQEIVAQD